MNILNHNILFERYFEEISRIPRGSGNEAGIAEYLMSFAHEHGLFAFRDSLNNVVIRKAASRGHEGAPTVILHAHTDMVCVKEGWSEHDFGHDPLELVLEGDRLYANGTSLGADDGAGVATILALLADESVVSPPLEAFFTASEETGMYGAKGFDYSMLSGKRLITMDSGGENRSSVNAAACETMWLKLPLEFSLSFGNVMRLHIFGLQGGHSGSCIDMERGNAIKLAMLLMREYLAAGVAICLSDITAGSVTNAIPACSDVVFTCDSPELVERVTSEYSARITREFSESEPQLKIVLESAGDSVTTASREDSLRLIRLLSLLPSGRRQKSLTVDGFVTASSNLATVHTGADGMTVGFSLRAETDFKLDALEGEVKLLSDMLGVTAEVAERTPCWEYMPFSPMREKAALIMEKHLGAPLIEEFEHGGLECGYFAANIPGLDIFVIGPAGHEVHSTLEWLCLASSRRVYGFMKEFLKNLAE